jgi:hypothetical protein
LVSGFWHGSNWTFIAWGAYHALLFMPLLLLGKNRKHISIVAENRLFPTIKEFIAMFVTFAFVAAGWIIFRAENIHQAVAYISRMASPSLLSMPAGKGGLLICIPFVIVEWFGRINQFAIEKIPIKSRILRIVFYYVIIFVIIVLGAERASFIYFQF